MSAWQLQPIFDQYLAVLLIAVLLLGTMWFVRPHSAGMTAKRSRVLFGLRSIVIVILLLLAVRPVIVRTRVRSVEQSIVFLVDASRSMTIADENNGATRWNALKGCLDKVRSIVQNLPRETSIRTILFSGESQLPSPGLLSLDEVQPTGSQSDLGGALQSVMEGLMSEELRAIILLSDGAQRAVRPVADAERMASELARRNTALIAVPLGRGRDETQSRDVSVESLPETASVFVKNQLAIGAGLRIIGYPGRGIPVHVALQRNDEPPQNIETRSVTPNADSDHVDVEFHVRVDEPGEYQLVVQAEPQDGELITANNRQVCFLRVQEGGLSTIYVEGNPLRQEYQGLVRSWRESPDIQLDPIVLSRRRRDKWPLPLPTKKYDVYVLGDIEASALAPGWIEQMRSHVEQGSGLIALGGFHTMGPGKYADTPLRDMLPIRMNSLERQPSQADAPIREDIQLKGELFMVPQREHPLLHINDATDLSAAWKGLPPLDGALRWSGLKPDAILLAASQHADPYPLLVAGQYGEGHVLAFAGFSTWRWQTRGFADQHRRFWRQVLLWLAQRDELPKSQLKLTLNRRRVNVGEEVIAEIAWTDLGQRLGTPIVSPAITAEVHVENQSLKVEPVPGTAPKEKLPEVWTAKLPTLSAGMHELEVSASNDGRVLESVRVKYVVVDRDLELEDPAANPSFLERLARHTQSSGGQVVAPEQLTETLLEMTNMAPIRETEVVDRRQLVDRTVDAWVVYSVSAVCLTLEWFLRKKWGMV